MNETLLFIITENQKHLESPTPIVKRDLEILPVPRKATVATGVRKCGKFTLMRERIERLLDEGVGRENICCTKPLRGGLGLVFAHLNSFV